MEKKYWGSKFYSSRLNTVLLFILIILMFGAIYLMLQDKQKYFSSNSKLSDAEKWARGENEAYDRYQKTLMNQISGNKDDLLAFSIMPNTKVHGVVSYRGIVKGGYFFEANILVNVLDMNKNVLLKSNGVAKGDWMTIDPVNFEGNLDFTNIKKGPAYIEIQNDDPSGGEGGPAKKIQIPIIVE